MIDATVVGSGPNGLAAAVTLARAGLSVRILERNPNLGGGLRSAELTLPGFRHDLCATVLPAAIASPFFRGLGIAHRVSFAVPEVSYGHALTPYRAVLAHRDLAVTVSDLGRDGPAWRRLLGPLADNIEGVTTFTSAPLVGIPRPFGAAARFAIRTLAARASSSPIVFRDAAAPALLAGVMAHANARQPSLGAAAVGLVLAAHGHAGGWVLPRGGAQTVADALVDEFRRLGGEVVTGVDVRTPADVGASLVTLLDTAPDHLLTFGGNALPARYRRALSRYRRGPGVAKIDAALSGPIPWRDSRLSLTPTVHLGGDAATVAQSERAVHEGRHAAEPYVLVVQPSAIDPSRAPVGQHVLWAYIHVPNGSPLDPTETILAAIERHAPGFRDLVLAVTSSSARDLAHANPNDAGGDILGGAIDMAQLAARPVLSSNPWRTPIPGLYLCSSSTPPGPGVHGMSGWSAARAALREQFGVRSELPDDVL